MDHNAGKLLMLVREKTSSMYLHVEGANMRLGIGHADRVPAIECHMSIIMLGDLIQAITIIFLILTNYSFIFTELFQELGLDALDIISRLILD